MSSNNSQLDLNKPKLNKFLREPFRIDDAYELRDENKQVDQTNNAISLLIFEISNSLYAIKSESVHFISNFVPVERVPFVKNRFNLGFIAIKGVPIPVMNLNALLGLVEVVNLQKLKLIIFKEEGLLTAIFVESIIGVQKCSLNLDLKGISKDRVVKVNSLARSALLLNTSELSSLLEER